MKTRIEVVSLDDLKLDTRLQIRESINSEKVTEYAEAMRDGEKFPPIEAKSVDGELLITDGFHRWYSAREAGFQDFETKVTDGTFLDALFDAVGANWNHGIPRTYEGKRKAVLKLLAEPECTSFSDLKIASLTRLSNHFVGKVRAEFEGRAKKSVEKDTNRNIPIRSISDIPTEENMSQDDANKKEGWDKQSAQMLSLQNQELTREKAELEAEVVRLRSVPSDGPVGAMLSDVMVENERLKAELARAESGNERLAELYSEANAQAEKLRAELAASEARSLERRDRNLYLTDLLKEHGIGFDPAGSRAPASKLVAPPAPRVQAAARSNEVTPRFKEGFVKDKPARGRQVSDDD